MVAMHRLHLFIPTKMAHKLHLTNSPMTAFVNAMFLTPNDGPYLQQYWAIIPKDHIIIQELFKEVPSGICTRFHKKLLRIQASRIAFSPDEFTLNSNLFSAHNTKFPILFSQFLVTGSCKGVPDPGILCILSEEYSTVELCLLAPFWGFPGIALSLVLPSLLLLQLHPLFELFCQCRSTVCIVISIQNLSLPMQPTKEVSEAAKLLNTTFIVQM